LTSQHHLSPEQTALRGSRRRPTPARRLITLSEAAELLGMSVVSVRRLVWGGTLRVARLNRRVLVDLRDLDSLIEQAKDRRSW
jgi:excisionase family DNA binding protein